MTQRAGAEPGDIKYEIFCLQDHNLCEDWDEDQCFIFFDYVPHNVNTRENEQSECVWGNNDVIWLFA